MLDQDESTHESTNCLSDARAEAETCIVRHRETIDKELCAVADKSRFLNSLLPVSKLLPEILIEIFMKFATNPMHYFTSGFEKPVCMITVYDWMAVTRVCHSWRQVALGAPKLWSYIYLGSTEHVKTFLARSGQTPLHIRPWNMFMSISYGGYFPNPFTTGFLPILQSARAASLRLILMQVYRIESLSLNESEPVLERVFSQYEETIFRAPALKSIKFKAPSDSNIFPHILKRCDLPSLTHVEVRGFHDPWQQPFLQPKLTSLSLHNTLDPHNPDYMRGLLSFLSDQPQLESLTVHSDICEWCSEEFITHIDNIWMSDPVELSRLRDLTLHLSSYSVEAFIIHSNLPPTVRVKLVTAEKHSSHVTEEDALDTNFDYISQDPSIFTFILPSSLDVKSRDNSEWIDAPLAGLSIHLCTPSSGWPEEAVTHAFDYEISIKVYYFEDSVTPTTDSLPEPHFTLQFRFNRDTSSADLLQALLARPSLDRVTYLNVSCLAPNEMITPSSMGRLPCVLFHARSSTRSSDLVPSWRQCFGTVLFN
ncbi:hypothetical protein QCA50_005687 [Cerrena zonata]|uniref:F-box domain-containing protein n=1 Tax=Cerrena zonata TaxID=2478898 RepID=A0AAW0GH77_9APHY